MTTRRLGMIRTVYAHRRHDRVQRVPCSVNREHGCWRFVLRLVAGILERASRARLRTMKPEGPGLDGLNREHALVPGVGSELLAEAVLILVLHDEQRTMFVEGPAYEHHAQLGER